MSFDLQILRDTAPALVALAREHAIYRDAQKSSDRKVQKPRSVADLLERGHRVNHTHTSQLIDLRA